MGFDICLTWPHSNDDAIERNQKVKEMLLAQFLGLHEFPLDHDLIATELEVARNEVLHHWFQYELNGTKEAWSDVIIHIYLDYVNLELHSTPKTTCVAELAEVQPIMEALTTWGYVLDDANSLLENYEKQQAMVQVVADIICKQ